MENAIQPAPIPEATRGSRLPDRPIHPGTVSDRILQRVKAIPLFSTTWKEAGEVLASLVSTLREEEAEGLLESLSHMSEPPPVIEDTAVKWFSAARNLPPETAVVAVQEFLHLGWTWNQIGPSTGLIFEDLLTLFYNALEVLGETPGDIGLAQNLIRAGFTWPERFSHILECTRIGGGNVIRALDRAKELMPEAIQQARSTLVDFAAGTGWFLLDAEDLPVWRAVSRNGESLYRLLRGFSVPIESMKLLAGVLGSLEDAVQLEAFLEDSIHSTAREILGSATQEELQELVLRLTSGAVEALKRKSEQNLCTDLLSTKTFSSAPYLSGRAIGSILLFLGGGKARQENLVRILDLLRRSTPGPDRLQSLAGILQERTGVPPFLAPDADSSLKLIEVVVGFLDPPTGTSKRTLNSIGHLIDAIFSGENIPGAVEMLSSQLRQSPASPALVLSAAVLLLRTAEQVPIVELIPKSGMFAKILELLSENDRSQILEGARPQWLSPMAVSPTATVQQIVQSIEKVSSRDLRGRFLENVVTPLIEETCHDDPVFQELLSTGILTYNQDMTLELLREAEMTLLRKLFRAEDRTRCLGLTMERLLSIPGIEENRAGEVVGSARELCEKLSQQAVWLEKTGNVVYSRFLTEGLPDYVRTLVEYTNASDVLTGGLAVELLGTLMPSRETQDSQVALWQLRTVTLFFGRIIPLATEILAGYPGILVPYLREMAALSVSSRHGEPAGVNFLAAVVSSLEERLIREFERRLHSDSPPEELPTEISGPVLLEKWIRVRDTAEALLKTAAHDLRPVVTDKIHRRVLIREGRRLIEGLLRNGSVEDFSLESVSSEARGEILRLRKAAGDVDLLRVFTGFEDTAAAQTAETEFPGARGFFREHPAPPGENACRYWRRRVFSPLENLLIDIMMLFGEKPSDPEIDRLLSDFIEITEYLGTEEEHPISDLYQTLEKSLSTSEGGAPPTVTGVMRSLERNIYKPRWRRQATAKTLEASQEPGSDRKIVKRLFDRMAAEGMAKDMILFMKRYGRLFAAIEEDMTRRKKIEYKAAKSVLDNTWLFNPAAQKSRDVVENAREAVETYIQYFREIGARTGAVSAPEAGAISLGMRRRYRDNAGTVATLLKWTQDPRKEKLLALVEDHPVLLEAVSRDSELIQLMDDLWFTPRARKYMKALADRPEKLREALKVLGGRAAGEGNGLKYV
jgi:hypothetical protein